MLLYQNQPETRGSLGRTRGSSRAPATVDGCNGGSRRRVRDPSLVEAGVSEEEGRKRGSFDEPSKPSNHGNNEEKEFEQVQTLLPPNPRIVWHEMLSFLRILEAARE